MTFSLRTLTICLALLATLSACASSGTGGPRSNPNILTAEELRGAPGTNLLDAIDQLRPRWLLARGPITMSGASGQVIVYLNNSYLGGTDELRAYTVDNVTRIRYIEGQRAAAVLSGYPSTIYVAGAIVMETAHDE